MEAYGLAYIMDGVHCEYGKCSYVGTNSQSCNCDAILFFKVYPVTCSIDFRFMIKVDDVLFPVSTYLYLVYSFKSCYSFK